MGIREFLGLDHPAAKEYNHEMLSADFKQGYEGFANIDPSAKEKNLRILQELQEFGN